MVQLAKVADRKMLSCGCRLSIFAGRVVGVELKDDAFIESSYAGLVEDGVSERSINICIRS